MMTEAGKLRPSVASAALFNAMQEAGVFGRKRQSIEDAARNLAVAVRDEAVAARNAEIAEAVRELLDHQVTGYEWECGTCAYDVKAGINRAPDGSPCPVDSFEDEAISRAAVLAIIEKP